MLPLRGGRTTGLPACSWWLVLCLIGLDYFSTLAYLPSLAVESVGPLAPLAAAVVVVVTLLVALPIYCYVVGRSPHGRGGTGLIEQRVPGWSGKLIVLLLLAFVATDYVVTQNLSIADAAEHLRANPYVKRHLDPSVSAYFQPDRWSAHPSWQRVVSFFDRQLTVTLLLSVVSFSLWAWWCAGSPRLFLRIAAVVVVVYLLLNAIVVGSGLHYLATDGQPILQQWLSAVRTELTGAEVWPARTIIDSTRLFKLVLVSFPYVALGLSGFELSMAVTPLIRGDEQDDPQFPRGRIRNMRKLLFTAALVMACALLTAVTVAATLVPAREFQEGGKAQHRALSYLAHGHEIASALPGHSLNSLFGPVFGTLYDATTVAILCLAGACVTIALRDYVPEYLKRFGMELNWAHRLGIKMRFFNVLVLLVVFLFHAQIASLQWVYATSVLVLLSGGTLAAVVDLRQRFKSKLVRFLVSLPATLALLFFVCMVVLTLSISRAGLEIALAFGIGILVTSFVSRWIRSTELRIEKFEFVDAASEARWQHWCAHEFQVLVPHRPGHHSRVERERSIRTLHRIGPEVPVLMVEVELGDPSEFYHQPLICVTRDNGTELIQVSRCASVAHVIAAMALEMAQVGRPPEVHFGWSDESPLAANFNFLLFGEGNIPWMVRSLVQQAEPNAERRPAIIIG
ncbi:MAG: amino acid transporter [Planctomycetes bacterium]|nr:amino acid transporter [Planctomycetota bacterium]